VKFVNINTDSLCHILCSYLQGINIPLAFYIYAYNPNEKYIFDMIGITTLAVSSYNYHIDVYKRLNEKQLNEKQMEDVCMPNKSNIRLFLNDIIAIHMRSFLVIVTNYYNNQQLLFYLLISVIIHTSSIYYCFINALELIIEPDKNKNSFLILHNIMSSIPVAFDVFLLYMNSPNEIAIPYLLVNISMGFSLIIEPFYKLTHVFFHILLIGHTYYMCLSNIK
jgi:hypothetical protein